MIRCLRTVRLAAVMIFALLVCGFVHAQQSVSLPSTGVPRLVNFSGKAIDAQGKTLIGIAGVTFAIYADQFDGAPLWMETQNVQADTKGNYSVQLGATKPDGLPLDLFTSSQARWLGVTTNGGEEQPRILLLSVPYALKAADAETLGGLPASAFALATPVVAGHPSSNNAAPPANAPSATPLASSEVTTSGGTVNAVPLFTTATNVQNSLLTQTGTSAINVAGKLNLPATGTASTTTGKNSQPETFVASAFNKTTDAAAAQTFQLQAEPAGNDTTSAGATFNLLYGSGNAAPAETGLKIGQRGLITFAAGQTFPTVTGNETVTGDLTASELISTVATGTAPLKVTSTTQVANLNASFLGGKAAAAFATIGSNTFVGTQSITGSMGIGAAIPAQALDLGTNNNMVIRVDPGSDTTAANGGYELVGRGAGGVPNTWWTYTASVGGGFGVPANSYSIWQYPPNATPGCCLNRFTILPAAAPTDTGGTVTIDQNGNAAQPLAAGGFAKAMLFYSPNNGARIVRCFNSTLSGAAATTPPCGFTIIENFIGDYILDLGFQIDDRFLSATGTWGANGGINGSGLIAQACTDISACNNSALLTPNRVELTSTYDDTACSSTGGACFIDNKIYLIVY
jgi:hypothetical protein